MEETTGNSSQGAILLVAFVVIFVSMVIMYFNLKAENRRRRKRNEPDADAES